MRCNLFSLLILITVAPEFLFALTVTPYLNVVPLPVSFDPVIAAYWTGLKHRRRVNFGCSPDKLSCYLAYLDASEETIHVLTLDARTFKPRSRPVQFKGHEAGGLVAHNDGFALLTIVGGGGSPPRRIATVVRFRGQNKIWETPLNGPGIHPQQGITFSPDLNGELVWSERAQLYAAYFVVTATTGPATGHYGDSIQYVGKNGARVDIPENNWWGCSHNTGIAFEAADEPPFASICAEDHGAIWLNTKSRDMSADGLKISNENTTNGSGGEAMGGMGGSFSNLARFQNSDSYIFAWQSRGCTKLARDPWMEGHLGTGYTTCLPRWLNHNVAIAILPTKDTLLGPQAISTPGAVGDKQIRWLTYSSQVDAENVRVATFNSKLALVTWDNLTKPKCQPLPMSCNGTYSGTTYQLVNVQGSKSGTSLIKQIPVGGDMVTLTEGKICWPYVPTTWDYNTPKTINTTVMSISVACAALN
ncbi:hypothetical protein O181_021910 [Austropuccinia psidii MF-1]|uniref:Uncharacterized protein n=1 Tax=Austropuccinia psidii MF-1 TaxID=1389203 RepID=A0A9Q3CFG6_9BASI|nr:hypothetical protein [Austropuccinia psidii MF-1]